VSWTVIQSAEPGSRPVLDFEGYERSETSAGQVAKLKLRNTTSKPIWLFLSGENFSRPEFLERPVAVQPPGRNDPRTNVHSIRLGSFSISGKRVLPGKSLEMEFPLVSGKAPEQVGLCYYVGNFKDGNEFIHSLRLPLLIGRASLKDKVEFYWENFKRKLTAPKCYEVWCAQPLSFQTGKATNSAK
jgi:hypothetical protein